MNFKKAQRIGLILAFVPALLTVGVWIALRLDYPDLVATAALGYAVLAFIAVWFTLYATLAQLQKALAKPKLEVMFTENGKKEWELHCSESHWEGIPLWINNNGNAVAELFSIDLTMPTIFMPRIQQQIEFTTNTRINEKGTTASFINNRIGKYVCFVNKPVEFGPLLLKMEPTKYDEYENPFIIQYKIFGNWETIQEGTLKVTINKQEVIHVPTSS
jgi:hypothetical protein